MKCIFVDSKIRITDCAQNQQFAILSYLQVCLKMW